MDSAETGRYVTRARRQFGPDEVSQLDRTELRKLYHALLLAEGASIDNYRTTAEFDEFSITARALWSQLPIVVRIYKRPIAQADIDDIDEFITTNDAVEAWVVVNAEPSESVKLVKSVRLISAGETATRITRSALTSWEGGIPYVSMDRLQLHVDLTDTAALLDPVGIQWLPSLALNELPPTLSDLEVQPQDLLERKAFRLLTATFRFEGERYGEARRGERLPDALLMWPSGEPTAAILECKAASSGYSMSSDHVLRLIRYWEELAPSLEEEGIALEFVIVVSSYFPGADGDRHPFYGRSQEIREKTGMELCYVMASDMAWIASELESHNVPLSSRKQLNWKAALANGLVTRDHIIDALGPGIF